MRKIFALLILLFFVPFLVQAKEVSQVCKYTSNNGYNTLYIEIYDDQSAHAYVKKYLHEDDGTFTTYDGYGNSEDVQNWEGRSTCPSNVLITNGFFGFDVYASDQVSELETLKGSSEGFILGLETGEVYATCNYEVPYTPTSYFKFKIVIVDENYTKMYYMKNGEEEYYDTNFDKLLLSPTSFSSTGIGTVQDLGSTINSSEVVYAAFQDNGYKCPYIISSDYDRDGQYSIAVSSDSYHDGTSSFVSRVEAEYTENTPEQTTLESECISHFKDDTIPGIKGAQFYFRTYSDDKKEFCVKFNTMTEPSCTSFYDFNRFDAIIITDEQDNSQKSFNLSSLSWADFFGDSCIGSNFYVYEQAGQEAGVYILTTDEEEASQGTHYTPGEEGELEPGSGNQDFNPNGLCSGENCNISLALFCNDGNVARTLKFIGLVFFIAKILVPAIIIVVGIVDLIKVITSGKEEDMKKHAKNIGMRVVIGVLIFLLPSIIDAVYDVASDIVSNGGTSAFDNCEACLMTPNSSACYVEESED